jgi:hypothetical protein
MSWELLNINHLQTLIDTGDAEWAKFQDSSGSWVERDDVFVTFDREYGDFETQPWKEGALSSPEGFGSGDNEFGPKVGFGFELTWQSVVVVGQRRTPKGFFG